MMNLEGINFDKMTLDEYLSYYVDGIVFEINDGKVKNAVVTR